MKRRSLGITFLVVAAFSVGCKPSEEKAAAKAEAKPKVQALREQTAQLNRQLDEARSATEAAWDSVRAGFKNGSNELKKGFQHARQWASGKIAP